MHRDGIRGDGGPARENHEPLKERDRVFGDGDLGRTYLNDNWAEGSA